MDILEPEAHEHLYYRGFKPLLSVEDQMFMTFIRLRKCTPHFELGRWFDLSQNGVANVFITWVNIIL